MQILADGIELCAADDFRAHLREVALVSLGSMAIEIIGDHRPQNRVTEVLQTLVVYLVTKFVLPPQGTMRKGRIEMFRVFRNESQNVFINKIPASGLPTGMKYFREEIHRTVFYGFPD